MSPPQKKHRHRRDHAHRQDPDRPQSTDIADVIEVDDASEAASKHQRDATAGPSEEDRFGEGPVASDAEGRILSVSVKGDMTEILIGLGKKQGIHVGMEGYIKQGTGMHADFQIHRVEDRTAFALVDTTPDAIQQTDLRVVVNPSSMPKSSAPKQEMKGRIIGVSIQGGRTRIMIGLGRRHGARSGMTGYVVGPSGGPLFRFVVDEEHPGHVEAFVDATIDMLKDHHQIVLNPS